MWRPRNQQKSDISDLCFENFGFFAFFLYIIKKIFCRFFFCGARVWTQGLVHARQMSYHRAGSPACFSQSFVWNILIIARVERRVWSPLHLIIFVCSARGWAQFLTHAIQGALPLASLLAFSNFHISWHSLLLITTKVTYTKLKFISLTLTCL